MQFESLSEFFNMGGYAFYVWLAYGTTFGCLAALILSSRSQQQKVLTEIAKKIVREERLKEHRSTKA
ncbi:heme exporter protein CcmD [Shewanella sedimentimangrovi]|uniref:Heme exporter protein D n=1 Tax=Shewanella sedimentimangrovi TaxID=2814293 RepID=A0ABX7R135_9GAMM|nr:heme exporter protein CcmD [Shewanella sedimentimangrovi]QSX37502.1 heme exporter protein CcmD [Shewanella sedimentimangrovi]